jgi:integrase/recombinase XerD
MKRIHFEVEQLGDLADSILSYLQWMAVTQYAVLSCKTRRSDLHIFYQWCLDRSLLRPQEITRVIVEQYQRYLFHFHQANGQPLSVVRQSSLLISVRGLFKWLAKYNHILYNPTSELDMPQKGHYLPQNILTHSEVDSILNQPDINHPLGYRDRAILETLYSTGVRRKELCQLATFDLNREKGTLSIRHGKGNRDRMIPIGDRAMAWIYQYETKTRPKINKKQSDALFLNYKGDPFSADGLSHLVHRYIKQAGIQKSGCCHMFRHSMATLMLENGADTRIIQKILGHAKLESTQIYTKVSIQLLKETHNITHPGAKLKPSSNSTHQ